MTTRHKRVLVRFRAPLHHRMRIAFSLNCVIYMGASTPPVRRKWRMRCWCHEVVADFNLKLENAQRRINERSGLGCQRRQHLLLLFSRTASVFIHGARFPAGVIGMRVCRSRVRPVGCHGAVACVGGGSTIGIFMRFSMTHERTRLVIQFTAFGVETDHHWFARGISPSRSRTYRNGDGRTH